MENNNVQKKAEIKVFKKRFIIIQLCSTFFALAIMTGILEESPDAPIWVISLPLVILTFLTSFFSILGYKGCSKEQYEEVKKSSPQLPLIVSSVIIMYYLYFVITYILELVMFANRFSALGGASDAIKLAMWECVRNGVIFALGYLVTAETSAFLAVNKIKNTIKESAKISE